MKKIQNKTLEYYMGLKYPIQLTKEDDGSYFIEYPDLEGCFSCGETIESAIQMGEDARRAWTEAAIENEIFIPEPKSVSDYPEAYKLHLPKSLYKQLQTAAKTEGCSMNQYCVYLLSKGCVNQ